MDAYLQAENQSIFKKLDIGYVFDLEMANMKPTNRLGLKKPMLAVKWGDVNNIDYSQVALQYKYDGHRCLIYNDHGTLIAYSRNGKPI